MCTFYCCRTVDVGPGSSSSFPSGVSSRRRDVIYGGARESMKLSEWILPPRPATPHNSFFMGHTVTFSHENPRKPCVRAQREAEPFEEAEPSEEAPGQNGRRGGESWR